MDQVSQIREKIDIVSFLSETMTLKKAGRNMKAVCPFHNEKSPSFMVSPERQMWHCFGCGKGGDIYTFVMEYEHIEFPEALRILAKRAGIELVQSQYEAGLSSKKEKLYSLNKIAAEYYHYILTKHTVGKKALEYLKVRGLNDRVMETFLLGFAPSGGTALSSYLLKKKQYTQEDLVDGGLAFQRGRDTVDFFRGRIIFPLIDHRDNVIGFAGRILADNPNAPKYINTRETFVYHKGEHFYGLNVTKDAIRKAGQAILVEGEFDVLSSFQEGVSNVAAVKGTALTEQQVNLISRYASKITICFDGDRAGQEAIKRSLPLLERKNLQASVIVLTEGKDPDEAIKLNPAAYKAAVKKDHGVYDYLFDAAVGSADAGTAEGKQAIADAFLPVASSMTNEIVKEHYLRKLSLVLETTYESIMKEMTRRQKPQVIKVEKAVPASQKRSREEVLEEYLLALLLQSSSPAVASATILSYLEEAFEEKAAHKLIKHVASYAASHPSFDMEQFVKTIPAELQQTFTTGLLFPLPSFQTSQRHEEEIDKVAVQLRELYLRDKLKKVSEELAAKEKAGSSDELSRLQEQYTRLISKLQKV